MNIPHAAVQAALDVTEGNVPPIMLERALTAAYPHLPLGFEVPEGWQLVPKEPTFEMAKAAIDLDPKSDLDAKYKAMLSAVPQVATKPVDVAAVRRQMLEDEIDSAIEKLLDIQQDINFEANSRMSQSLCDASAYIDKHEAFLRRILALSAETAQGEQWDEERRNRAAFSLTMAIRIMTGGDWEPSIRQSFKLLDAALTAAPTPEAGR